MNITIKKYSPNKDYLKLLALIKSEGSEWEHYVLSDKYENALAHSITYVAYVEDELCGFSRSMSDFDAFIWVIDLLVQKEFRGNSIGKKLLECITTDYPNQEIYIMSDVDEYYEKLGYSREGSIFKIV